jgi:hypothetical protein
MIQRPSALLYQRLEEELTRANSEVADDELIVALKCLVATLRFLDVDPEISQLTRPLGTLAFALRDLVRGAKPPLLFAKRGEGGRPQLTSFDHLRGTTAALVEILMRNEKRKGAANFVANALQQEGITLPNKKPISPTALLNWRSEMGGGASPLTELCYQQTCALFDRLTNGIADRPSPRTFVEGTISDLRGAGF